MIETEMSRMYRPWAVGLTVAALVIGTGALGLLLAARVLL